MSVFTQPWRPIELVDWRGVRRRRRLLRRLSGEQNHRCAYCGRRFGEEGDGSKPSLEHVIPKAKGGEDSWQNCVAACVRCNSRRDLLPAQWFLYVTEAMGRPKLPRKLRWPDAEAGTSERTRLSNERYEVNPHPPE